MKLKTPSLDRLLSPSWLSGLIAVTGGLVVTGGVIVAFSFNNSQIQQQLVGWQSTSAPALALPGQDPSDGSTDSLQNTWPLIGFWMAVGVVVYFIVMEATRGLNNLMELRKELDYVHVQRSVMLKNILQTLALRLLTAAAWLLFIDIFFKRAIPYSITAAHAAASDPKNLLSFLYAALAFCVISLCLHLHVVFLRLIAGRVRLFSDD